jgi:chromate transporter
MSQKRQSALWLNKLRWSIPAFKKEFMWSRYVEIFLTFLKIAPLTFGGGYAIIPLLEQQMVQRKKWMTGEEITDVLALAGAIPGAIAVNSATFIGYRLAGFLGALSAMIGILTPTFFIILVLATAFLLFQHNPIVQSAFLGIRPAIIALIIYAAFKIGKSAIVDRTTGLIAIGALWLLLFSGLHPALLIVAGGMVGYAVVRLKRKLGLVVPFDNNNPKDKEDADYFYGEGI